jgi:hypothetical protein
LFWAAVLVVALFGAVVLRAILGPDPQRTIGNDAQCMSPADDWVRAIESTFRGQGQQASIVEAGFVEVATSDGAAYYVALEFEGIDRPAVFSTTNVPTSAPSGLLAAANNEAQRLSDLGAGAALGSPFDRRLRDANGIRQAIACLS